MMEFIKRGWPLLPWGTPRVAVFKGT